MKTKLLLSLLALLPALSTLCQVPQGFNYQAIARNASGDPFAGATIKVKLSILSDTTGFYAGTGGTYVWEEEHSGVKTNEFGLFTIVLGSPSATWVQGSATTFSGINWSATDLYIGTKIANPTTYIVMGSAKLWSVPYSMVAGNLDGAVSKLEVKGEDVSSEEALFEVKRKDGRTMFAVYNHGVRVYMPLDTLSKARKGGFAIGGFSTTKADVIQDYFVVNADSIRAYIDSNPPKARKGGFAIGSFNKSKTGGIQEYLTVSSDSVRVYIDENITKARKGGFAIGSFDASKAGKSTFFDVSPNTSDIILSESRILWYPVKNAFLTGRVKIEDPDSVGENSFASGYESKARGQYSQALGYQAIARGDYSTAIGKNAVAYKINSFAFGENAVAKNEETYAFGRGAIAEGFRSYAFGSAGIDSAGQVTGVAYAKGDYSFAVGQGSQALGRGAIAIGIADTAKGYYSAALGLQNSSTGFAGVSFGQNTLASGYVSTAMGYRTQASGERSTAMGVLTIASGASIYLNGILNNCKRE